MICPYCGEPARVMTGAELYPHRADLAAKRFWRCAPCDAHVGCHHDDPKRPLGRMANAALRRAKGQAHAAFDPFWKGQGWKRGDAYAWLAEMMELPRCDCHIGMFTEAQCAEVVRLVMREKPRRSDEQARAQR